MSAFATRLVDWQRRHGRSGLPWQVADPYRVWVSEIMLQQTQVATVLDYYPRFMARFPTVGELGRAALDEVLALWSGLGYYSRARNLHKAAQRIVTEHDGVFPQRFEQVLDLPGIGRSTAAAICAFARGERRAILDGNVRRVLARWGGIEGFTGGKAVENRLWTLAESLLPAASADMVAYTQGLMDLGSLVCTRGKPACGRCPLAADCVALRDDRVGSLPTPRPKKAQPTRDAVWLLARDSRGRVLLERRPESGIWGGLWSLPELASSDAVDAASAQYDFKVDQIEPAWHEIEHVFTHFRLLALPLPVRVAAHGERQDGRQGWFLPAEALTMGLPAPVRRLLDAPSGTLF
ncbi:A/G-specific DNA-adenine glycosylase [Microvirgula sp. AG722]|uniref:A/G-specific adenine glycosylase n=1 Tax=Microvirgula sp. AG722 TaxID=2183901 RepID=UPI000DC4B882|nr:A/G-specific adenine glycosylase [Microvirgula sp. AG722]RAS19743.1 A/G-specific DNA-adenine glycosylase [Microvirgula sp. AG722]